MNYKIIKKDKKYYVKFRLFCLWFFVRYTKSMRPMKFVSQRQASDYLELLKDCENEK